MLAVVRTNKRFFARPQPCLLPALPTATGIVVSYRRWRKLPSQDIRPALGGSFYSNIRYIRLVAARLKDASSPPGTLETLTIPS